MDKHANLSRSMEPESPFLSVKASAAFLCISVATLYRLLNKPNGFPPPRKHAGRVLFRRDDLELWSNNQVGLPQHSLFQEARARSLKTTRHAVEAPDTKGDNDGYK